MRVLTIIYASRATAALDTAALVQLLEGARTRNRRNGVTGILLYAYESFMQQLEGDDAAVEAIFASIERDSRHTDLRLLTRRPITQRRYPDWSMGFEHPDAETLARRLPSYRPAIAQPLVDGQLVSDAEMAETILEMAAKTAVA